jgi:tetratricopeptide (TPR) repeat protein
MSKIAFLVVTVMAGLCFTDLANAKTAKEPLTKLSDKPFVQTRRQTLYDLLAEAETLVMQGDVKRAIAMFTEAQTLSPNQQIPALDWNSLCWYGSLWGQAAEVLSACDKAIELEPKAEEFRDSRGLARALMGNISGAIEDFQAFVNTTKDQERKIERQGWINMLRQGKNPFTPEQIRLLLRD